MRLVDLVRDAVCHVGALAMAHLRQQRAELESLRVIRERASVVEHLRKSGCVEIRAGSDDAGRPGNETRYGVCVGLRCSALYGWVRSSCDSFVFVLGNGMEKVSEEGAR